MRQLLSGAPSIEAHGKILAGDIISGVFTKGRITQSGDVIGDRMAYVVNMGRIIGKTGGSQAAAY